MTTANLPVKLRTHTVLGELDLPVACPLNLVSLMKKTTKLRGLGSPTPSKEQRVLSVELDGALTITVATFSPWDGQWRVIFNNPTGVRVLDERDTPEFWHISVELLDGTSNSVVYEVVEGGWLSQQLPHSPLMQSGFYSSIKEYLVAGDADCVSVLSEDEPKILRISESA